MTTNPKRAADKNSVRLVATRALTYATRRLVAEDPFSAPAAQARILVALKKARYATERPEGEVPDMPEGLRAAAQSMTRAPAAVPKPPADLVTRAAGAFDHDNRDGPGGSTAPEATDELKALRAEYNEVSGRRFFSGWTADQLRERIAAVKAAAAK
jgi:hypothetical protein